LPKIGSDISGRVFGVIGCRPNIAIDQDVSSCGISEGNQSHVTIANREKRYFCRHYAVSLGGRATE
jgi:hypothetical protein